MNENSWLNAVKDCSFVIHIASPNPHKVPKDESEVIKPALNGTLFVLKACVQEGSKVKRVVLTSSMVAIIGDEWTTGKVYSENDFSDAYTKSKILAERAAWDFVKERKKANQSCFDLVVMNPGFIFSIGTNLLLKLFSFLDKTIAIIVPWLDKTPKFDNDRFLNVLNIQPIGPKKSIIDMAYSMIERGFIPKKY